MFEQAQTDLHRPHPFASERVGFFSTRCSKTPSRVFVHCIDYHPVAERDYIEDWSVGVRIGPGAITDAMSRSIANSVGLIHVHSHGLDSGLPAPSPTDRLELPPLVKSLRNANSKQSHGWMILSGDDAWTSLSLEGRDEMIEESPVGIVGFPTTINRRQEIISRPKGMAWLRALLGGNKKVSDRYDRQSFLGEKSEQIIGQAVIGVVGLGGGGSHIVQQLAHLGFRNFVLCDHDRISETNLNRLVGSTRADVGAKRLKTEIAVRNVRKLHKDANISAYASKWENVHQSLIGCDLIIGCVDGFCARRDLEAFCRRHLLPYLDVGMDVHQLSNGRFEIHGQVILSMPGYPCMHCMGFLNDTVLGQEAQAYGAAGSKPQVVWSNGLLCSAAVGIAVDLFTDWSQSCRKPIYLAFKGSELSLSKDKRLAALHGCSCCHYPLSALGDPVYIPI